MSAELQRHEGSGSEALVTILNQVASRLGGLEQGLAEHAKGQAEVKADLREVRDLARDLNAKDLAARMTAVETDLRRVEMQQTAALVAQDVKQTAALADLRIETKVLASRHGMLWGGGALAVSTVIAVALKLILH